MRHEDVVQPGIEPGDSRNFALLPSCPRNVLYERQNNVRAPKTPARCQAKRSWRHAKKHRGRARASARVHAAATRRQQNRHSKRCKKRHADSKITHGCYQSGRGDGARTPMHDERNAACDVQTLRRLLLEGESPDRRNNSSSLWTPLHALCAGIHDDDMDDTEDRVACLRLLVDARANPDATCRTGHTALHWAAQAAVTAIVSLLLVAGANVNAANWNGWTALHFAVRGHRVESNDCVEVLLAAGASVNARGNSGTRPGLDIAVHEDYRRGGQWHHLRAGAEIPTDETDPCIIVEWEKRRRIQEVRTGPHHEDHGDSSADAASPARDGPEDRGPPSAPRGPPPGAALCLINMMQVIQQPAPREPQTARR